MVTKSQKDLKRNSSETKGVVSKQTIASRQGGGGGSSKPHVLITSEKKTLGDSDVPTLRTASQEQILEL